MKKFCLDLRKLEILRCVFFGRYCNSTEATEGEEDVICDAQCNPIKPINLEIDSDSDEAVFWDAQNKETEGEGLCNLRCKVQSYKANQS